MFKVHVFLKGKGDAFSRTGDVATSACQRLAPNIAGLVQSRASDQQLGEGEAAYRGSLEAWFKSLDAAQHGAIALQSAGLYGSGVKVSACVLGIERTVLRTASFAHGRGIKGVFPFNRRPDFTVTDFQHHWWHNHGPIAAQTESALGYLQCHPLPADLGGAATFDGVTELFWPDFASAEAAMASRQMTQDQSNDAAKFVDRESVSLFFAEEEVLLAP